MGHPDRGFDYDILAKCYYEATDGHGEVGDCGEPATHRVWWEEEGDGMVVCKEHFEFIYKCEKGIT